MYFSGEITQFPQLPTIHLDPKNSSSVVLPEKHNIDTPLLSIKQV